MANAQVNETLVAREMERLFSEISAKRGELCTNPVTGGEFVYGFDPIKQQKDAAYKRLLAREHFTSHIPPDAPLRPTDDYERNRAKHASPPTAQFAWSLESQDDLRAHPSFADLLPACCGSTTTTSRGILWAVFPLTKSPS